ncbi:MAG TPA: alpha/beta hydrolase [Pseudonocardiaceae bacterium]|jgi:pimeloyl-ACP methyl ester carboxylesterase
MISRRGFAKAVGAGAAAVSLGGGLTSTATAATGTDLGGFGVLKQVKAGELNIGYVENGPADGPVVICLHGFPYSIYSYVDVAPRLAEAGYRVIVPYLRGHGSTTFLSPHTRRDAQQTVFALDLIALMDALKIDKAVLAGYDWGSRTADIVAALWPWRVKALVSVSGYLITNLKANLSPIPPSLEWAWWYQYYFATERGAEGLASNAHDLGKVIWKFNSPTWNYTDATYDQTAAAFTNPDYTAIVLGNYRWRLSVIPSNSRYNSIENLLQRGPSIGVPTVTIDPTRDPFYAGTGDTGYRAHFTGPYSHRLLDIGHNVPQEAPQEFTKAVLDADKLS